MMDPQDSAGRIIDRPPSADSAPFGVRALRNGLGFLWPSSAPLDLRILGRTLLHAALVGLLAGVLGAAFFAALEVAQRFLLEGLAGYVPLRAKGETFLPEQTASAFRPWLLVLLPAVGGLASGILSTFLAPETAGGGGDAIIESYHHSGLVRRRVIVVKALAAICSLGTGGSGGREGPTMQIGGAIGVLVGRYLPASRRERRILFVAGIAAGMAAVFRTPLGAAILATEMLYRDDFESDALIPAILASVVAYAVVISVFGETTLFGQPARFPFVPVHLLLYGLLALVLALAAHPFLRALRATQSISEKLPIPRWARPALGGLAMGLLGTATVFAVARQASPGLGVFSGGYGVAQVAISGAPGLPGGWSLVVFLVLLGAAKLLASALTIGSGGAAGDFAPSLVMGGLLGSAFGHAAVLVFHDPRLNPAAFALVGMGTFYGGIAHVPLSAVVIVCELAGSYDLLVPMMLAVSVAFVALRRWTIYTAQPGTKADSPTLREEARERGFLGPIMELTARDVFVAPEAQAVTERTTVRQMQELVKGMHAQKVLAVTGGTGALRGLVDVGALQLLSADDLGWANAHDVMVKSVSVEPSDDLAEISRKLDEAGLPQLPILQEGAITGYVGETELAHAYARTLADKEHA
jgi:CIC family chloride channel protein